MYRIGTVLVFLAFFGQTPNLGSQEINSTIIQVEGKKDAALQALKNQGLKAIELKGAPFLLPSVELVGAEGPVEYGEMIHIKAIVDRSRLPEHLSSLKYQWTVFEDGKPKRNIVVWPDGTEIFFAAGMKPKKILIVLDIDCLFEIRQDIKVLDPAGKVIEGARIVSVDGKVITSTIIESEINSPEPIVKEIIVGNDPLPIPTPVPVPTPTPVPVPVPVPTPDLPAGQFGLAKTAQSLAVANVLAGERVKAVDLAASYESIAERINQSSAKQAAGVALTNEDLKLDAQSILTAIAQSNRTALGTSATAWQQWNKLYGDVVYDLYKNRKLNLSTDWETAFRETALGLRQVK